MPELPEVETIKRELSTFLKGKKIVKVEILRPKLIKGISASAFAQKLAGDTIIDIERRAKYLIVSLKSANALVFHLGLTGALLKSLKRPPHSKLGQEAQKYVRVSFHLSAGARLDFSDLRLFGKIWYLAAKKVPELPEIKKLGIEPFSKDFTSEWFARELSKRKTKIKVLLMDQAFIAGIGNIYANEALFYAGIHPGRPANEVNAEEGKKLHKALLDVLYRAIKAKGSSVDRYVDAEGEEGSFHLQHKVYDRKGEPCCRCKTKIQRISLGQRGTYFCPRCQK